MKNKLQKKMDKLNKVAQEFLEEYSKQKNGIDFMTIKSTNESNKTIFVVAKNIIELKKEVEKLEIYPFDIDIVDYCING